ncbi:MAG: YHS domain-containing protein [Fimbriimonadales bacterium]
MNKITLIAVGGTALAFAGWQIATTERPAEQDEKPVPYRNAGGKLVCPVMKTVIASEKKASGFSDYKGKRYYFCCDACKPAFDKNPAKFVSLESETKSKRLQEPTQIESVKLGKYVIELWPPEDGVFAGEEIDIEFGVFDSTQKDVEFGGMNGVDFDVRAVVTMPSMPGMPEQKPNVHKEGRVGVQGLELFFPHGGEYQIDLAIAPKGGEPINAGFKVNVGDERPADAAKKKPYELKVVQWPEHVRAGQPVDLRLQVVDTKTGKPVTQFDVAHEQKFHLLIASKDLTQFMHEHPAMAPDGTWTYRATFPAGGDWWVYGDVAPTGKGSRILINKVNVMGDPPEGKPMFSPNRGPITYQGLTGLIEPAESPIPIGKMTVLRVKLTDAKTGQPVGDTQPWLGAAGHLMILHEDGQTVVHSHPKDDEETQALMKNGEVRFTARFPKPGRYVAYSQFKRGGQIKTLGYTLEVK